MADLTGKEASQSIKVVGQDSTGVETTPVGSTTLGELLVTDTPDQTGVNTILNLTTTAIEGKVGANALANRKYVEMEALTTGVKWGYDTTCPFNLYKSQFFSLPAGDLCKVYFKMSSGTGQVAFGEK